MTGRMIERDRWDEVAGLLERALDIDPEVRVAFLKENTNDAEVLAEVLGLLEAGGGEFLEDPVLVDASLVLDPLLGSLAGNCRLVRLLGEGGTGSVYEAVRTLALTGAEQRVAVKIWHRRGVPMQEVRREAAMLARVDHPGIARLLDTGELASGQPYLVLELVEGVGLVEYARAKPEVERLRLISGICQAVEAAHRALIAHRDIKPSNILVTSEGAPKLIDFGISKSMEDETRTMDTKLTPRYASPEQLRGEAITTATDIYSLGVVMYEILTGRNPFEGKSGPELASAICQEIVPTPKLPRDLASIVLKAMARKPEERYGSALAVHEDLMRYRRREAVTAVEAGMVYRTRKFLIRNRFALVIGSVTVALLVAGFGQAYWEAQQAARRFEQVRGLARSLLFEIHDEVSKVPGTLESRKLILTRALEYLDQLAGDQSADALLQKDVAASYIKVGTVQGTMVRSDESLGRYGDARVSFGKAVAILERLYARSPKDRDLRLDLARSIDRGADACARLEDLKCSVEGYRRVLGLYELDARENPTDVLAQARWLTSRIQQMDPQLAKEDFKIVREEFHRVAVAFEALGKEPKIGRYQAYSYKRLGAVEGKLGNYDTAVSWYSKGQEIHRTQKDSMGESTCEVDIAWVRTKQKNYPKALESLDRALGIRRELVKGRREDQQSKLSLASALQRKADLMLGLKKWREGKELIDEGLQLLLNMKLDGKQNPMAARTVRILRLLDGDALWGLNRRPEARIAYQKALDGPPVINAEGVERARNRSSLSSLPGPAKPLQ